MSITVIYTKADNSTMSDTFAFTRNLSQAEFDKMVLHFQEAAQHLPNAAVVTTENLNAEPKPEELPAEEVQEHRITRDIPAEKIKKAFTTKKAA